MDVSEMLILGLKPRRFTAVAQYSELPALSASKWIKTVTKSYAKSWRGIK